MYDPTTGCPECGTTDTAHDPTCTYPFRTHITELHKQLSSMGAEYEEDGANGAWLRFDVGFRSAVHVAPVGVSGDLDGLPPFWRISLATWDQTNASDEQVFTVTTSGKVAAMAKAAIDHFAEQDNFEPVVDEAEMPTSPLHRDEPEGRDDRGRLHGTSAVQRLLNATPVGPKWNRYRPENIWTAADEVVERAGDETVRAALRRLLALHMFDLTTNRPKVAMRNVRVGDVVELGGVARTVVERHGDGQRGKTVQVQAVLQHAPGVEASGVFANGGDVQVPLLHRMSQEMEQRLFAEMVAYTEMAYTGDPQARKEHLALRGGLEKAYLMLTGADPERLYEEIQEAVQARAEQRIDETWEG